ncbi:MAG: hpch/hpai aldolase [Rhodospirillaceae bacterium]|nr:hpch/hpai aldolase [Rhodospirillaceae bacterium]
MQRTVRDLLSSSDIKIGFWVNEFMTPAIGHILRSAGCDLVTFDMEHSGLGFETVRAALRSAEAAGLSTIVRPPSKQYHDIARALDIGAKSLMFQMVDTAEEARQIVACMKYRPRGIRGVTTQHFYDRFTGGALEPKLKAEDEATTMIALVETRLGVGNADAIAAVEGVDGLYLGHVDLSVDLGIPGRYDDPRLLEATHTLAAACRNHGKHFVWDVDSTGELEDMVRRGADVIMCGADTGTLRDAIASVAGDVRRRCSRPV